MTQDNRDGESLLDLAQVAARTVDHYERHAERYWTGTCEHDVRQNIDALLDRIVGQPPFRVLDLGCGPGRDLKTFTELGHHAIGIDLATRFVEMARRFSGCEVWQQDFLALDLPEASFDGIYANAALFHVPSIALPDVLARLRSSLKPAGVLLSSNPRGDNREGWSNERYGAYYDLDRWRSYLVAAGFDELLHYYRPRGLPRDQQPWLASVWRRRDA
ncbi:MAG: class I SAM-dependent methyltransferase [Gammaproteobacteria bacterium]